MKRKPKQYSRSKRKEQIRLQFSVWHRNGYTEPKTLNRIAKAFNLEPSPHLRDILLEMVDEGDLTVEWREEPGKLVARVYSLVMTRLITEKFSRRHISVRSRGQAVGQLELPTW